MYLFFFFNDTATTEIYTLSLRRSSDLFCMIDVPDDGYLMKGECSGSPPVAKITEIAEAGDAIVGVSREIGPFVFDLRSGEVTRFSTVAEAASKLSPAPVLKSADASYRAR